MKLDNYRILNFKVPRKRIENGGPIKYLIQDSTLRFERCSMVRLLPKCWNPKLPVSLLAISLNHGSL